MKRSVVDCGDKKCTVEHVMVQDCYLFIHTNSSSCNIPCNLEDCKKELHHFISCPIWFCHNISTSTTTTTTTLPSPTTPTTTQLTTVTTTTSQRPITFLPIPIDHPGVTYTSLTLNIVLFLLLLYIFAQKCKKCLIRNVRNFRNRNRSNETNSERDPILARGEGQATTDAERPSADQARASRTRATRLRSNNDQYFRLTESDDENDGFARVELHGSSPRVPSFLNTPTNSPRTNWFRDPLGYFWPQSENIPIGRTRQPPPPIPTRSPTTTLSNTTFRASCAPSSINQSPSNSPNESQV